MEISCEYETRATEYSQLGSFFNKLRRQKIAYRCVKSSESYMS